MPIYAGRLRCIATILAIGALPASAQDSFVLDVPVFTTNGGNTLDGDDRITVTETGSVTIGTILDPGLGATGNNNELFSFGAITTNVERGHGISTSGNNNTLSNSVTISTALDQSLGLFAIGNDNSLSNSGSIETLGVQSHGVYLDGDFNSVANSGHIATEMNGAGGIVVIGDGNAVSNDGTLSTMGNNSPGISAVGMGNSIVNAGGIFTAGDNSRGISVGSTNNVIRNTGNIVAEDDGIYVTNRNNEIFNSGNIFSVGGGEAINIRAGVDTTINLLEGSRLFGGIRLLTTENSLAFGPGLNAVVETTDQLPDTITAPNDAFVVDGDTIITVDSTPFPAADQGVAALGGQVLAALDRLGPGGAAPEVTHGTAGDGAFSWGGAIGALGLGGETDTTASYRSFTGGIIGGHTWDGDNGFFLGLTGTRQETDSSFEADTGTLFAGLHGGWDRAGMRIDASLTIGGSSTDQTRIIANSAVAGPTMGEEEAESRYDSAFILPAVTFSRDMDPSQNSFTPSLRLRYGRIMHDGYSETGGQYPVDVKDRTTDFVELRLQAERGLEDKRVGDATISGAVRIGDNGAQMIFGLEAGIDNNQRADVSGGAEWVLTF